jgi:hypothetical protein
MARVMSETVTKDANVYRVCASADRWYVIQEPDVVPVACFEDKASALNYAMCLARGRVAWHLLLRQNGRPSESATRAAEQTHH